MQIYINHLIYNILCKLKFAKMHVLAFYITLNCTIFTILSR